MYLPANEIGRAGVKGLELRLKWIWISTSVPSVPRENRTGAGGGAGAAATKLSKDDSRAGYRFEGDGRLGTLSISKESGEVSLLEAAAQDEKGQYSQRAAAKLYKHWGAGELPSFTEWAS